MAVFMFIVFLSFVEKRYLRVGDGIDLFSFNGRTFAVAAVEEIYPISEDVVQLDFYGKVLGNDIDAQFTLYLKRGAR